VLLCVEYYVFIGLLHSVIIAVFGLVLSNFDELAHKRHTRMRVNHSAGSRLIKHNSRRVEKRAAHTSFSTDSFSKKIEPLLANATRGDHQSQVRLEVIHQMLNPCLELNLLRRHFKPILKRAKLSDNLRLYDLRHSCATLLLAANEHPKVVSERLGHASITLTLDTYSHVLPSMQQAASEKLESLLFK
jgi:hypothetical protein